MLLGIHIWLTKAPPNKWPYFYFLGTVVKQDGRDRRIGRRLGAMLKAAGFSEVEASASYECYWGRESVKALVSAWVEYPFLDEAMELGGTDIATIDKIRAALSGVGRTL